MTRRILLALSVAMIALLAATTALAQKGQPTPPPTEPPDTLNPDGDPYFGGRDLAAGFLPDPFITTMFGGGGIDLTTAGVGAGCAGFVNTVPDYVIGWTGQSNRLRIFYLSTGDSTLLVQTPSGQFVCNDDFDGLNPLVDISGPAEGEYRIWIGSYDADAEVEGYLMLSELLSSPYVLDSPLLASVRVGNTAAPPAATAEASG